MMKKENLAAAHNRNRLLKEAMLRDLAAALITDAAVSGLSLDTHTDEAGEIEGWTFVVHLKHDETRRYSAKNEEGATVYREDEEIGVLGDLR